MGCIYSFHLPVQPMVDRLDGIFVHPAPSRKWETAESHRCFRIQRVIKVEGVGVGGGAEPKSGKSVGVVGGTSLSSKV